MLDGETLDNMLFNLWQDRNLSTDTKEYRAALEAMEMVRNRMQRATTDGDSVAALLEEVEHRNRGKKYYIYAFLFNSVDYNIRRLGDEFRVFRELTCIYSGPDKDAAVRAFREATGMM